MKKYTLPFICMLTLVTFASNAQGKDTASLQPADTIRIGSMVIVKKHNGNSQKEKNVTETVQQDIVGPFVSIKFDKHKKNKSKSNISTSYLNIDLGFANYIDQTHNYAYANNTVMAGPPHSSALKLNNTKSSNFNLWIVQQKANLYKNKWNLKYGIGFEMFNFRFEQPISFRNDVSNTVYIDNVSFSKDKLLVKYLTIPFQLNFNSNPENKKGLYASLGMSAGYLLNARNKQISGDRGKQKTNGTFNLNDWRIATIGELGIGSFRIYGSAGLTNLFDKNVTNYDMTPYAIGIRLSHF